jgi:hypothetical protein
MPLLGTRGVASARGFGLFGLIPGDPFFSSTTLLLPGNGTNGAQNNTFLDGSTNNFTITRNGNTTQGTFSPFPPASGTAYSAAANGGSGYFDGSGDYLALSPNAVFRPSGNFTIEAWVYLSTVSGIQNIFTTQDGSGFYQFSLGTNGANARFTMGPYSGAYAVAINAGTLTTGTWTHIAVARSGTGSNNIRMWVNGTSVAQATSNATPATETSVEVGREAFGGSNPLTGYISGLRIVTGSAVYDPASSTITVPTAPLTAITNTSLLLNFTNAGVLDATAKNDLETVGNAQISTAQSKWGGASIAFDGTGDLLTVPDNNGFSMGNGNFTIEFWMYPLSSSRQSILWQGDNAGTNSSASFSMGITATSKIVGSVFSGGTAYDATSAASVTTNAWTHVALVRNGNTNTLYLNGTADGTANVTGVVVDNSAQPVKIGDYTTGGGGLPFNGYIDDFRITKGVARYTANFTAPTAAFPLY